MQICLSEPMLNCTHNLFFFYICPINLTVMIKNECNWRAMIPLTLSNFLFFKIQNLLPKQRDE